MLFFKMVVKFGKIFSEFFLDGSFEILIILSFFV